ncbi:sugar tyrosine-protein kinase [Citrobacter sedlakii]|uniref:sugar tyrosine-protein kinase n=1 Tax=Citrobacter sedlakii TaxID=67826 RepID=UPI003138F7B1
MESKKYILIAVAFFFAVLTAFTWRVIALSVIQDDAEVRNEAQQNILYLQGLYNKNDFSTIYANGTDDFKNITNKEDFLMLMKRKKEVLGDFIKFDLISSNVINSNVVVLSYRSTYTHYSLIEEFTLMRKDETDKLRLGTYFIDDGGKRGKVIKL